MTHWAGRNGLSSRASFSLALAMLATLSCGPREAPPQVQARSPRASGVVHPEWSYTASIYEVNGRQYTPEGTFAAFARHLPRLKEMGVDILWFMPIHPIGEKNRKGSLGSYYSVRDYRAVNPEFGTLEDFRTLVRTAHGLGQHVLIDWVANHCAWDNPLVAEHPDWFTRDASGEMVPPVADWQDVVDLDYGQPALADYMLDAMEFWVREAGVDGFRCDVAGMVPLEFWERARRELDAVKPVFLLAEAEGPQFHDRAFDMTYDWGLSAVLTQVARGERRVADLESHFRRDRAAYAPDAFRMTFTSNHDENSWNGTEYERLGDAAAASAVLTLTAPGMPLLYSGQEAGLDHRLAFFDKDEISWRDHPAGEIYSKLLALKHSNRALRNGARGGELVRLPTSRDASLFAFLRERDGDRVVVVLNFGPEEQEFAFEGSAAVGEYEDVLTGGTVSLAEKTTMKIEPWGYRVYTR